jgi:uncharacterized metal-binding protein YceD (DUF177 family)
MAETQKSKAPAAGEARLASPVSYRVAGLSGRKPTRFRYLPDATARRAMAKDLNLLDLPALEMVGEIRPEGRGDFRLEARLKAQAVQACSVTLAPVPARVDEAVLRRFLAVFEYSKDDETETPQDDTTDPMPEFIDLSLIAAEALALALPLYPRAPGAELGTQVFAPPGAAPLTDEVLKPFAGLAAALKKPAS